MDHSKSLASFFPILAHFHCQSVCYCCGFTSIYIQLLYMHSQVPNAPKKMKKQMNPIPECTISKKDIGFRRSCLTPGCSCTSGAPAGPGANKLCFCLPGEARRCTLVWLYEECTVRTTSDVVQSPGPSSKRHLLLCAGALLPSPRRRGPPPIIGGR